MTAFAPARRLAVLREYASGVAVAAAVALLASLGFLEPLEYWTLGRLFEWRGPRPPQAPIVIVSIEAPSSGQLEAGGSALPALPGPLLRTLAAARPIAIGVDLPVDRRSSRDAADDPRLADAVGGARNVVLGVALPCDTPAVAATSAVVPGASNALDPPLPRDASALAPIVLGPESDGAVHRVPLRVVMAGQRTLGFDARLHELAASAGLPAAHLPAARAVLINFRGGPRTYPWVSSARVVGHEVPAEVFRDKIVLVGPTSPELRDVLPTPFARRGEMPGVEIHANALDTILRGDYVREAPRSVSVVLAAAAALLATAAVRRLRAWDAFVVLVLGSVVLLLLAFSGLVFGPVWIRGMAASVALVVAYGAEVVTHVARRERQKRRLSPFLPPLVLREVARRPDGAFGARRRLVTVLVSGIREFASLSATLSPEQVAALFREYRRALTEIAFKYHGTVATDLGERTMALFNAPVDDAQHAINALQTGLDLQERTREISARWEATLGVAIRAGVGIDTGRTVVGALDVGRRLAYTAIGDTVTRATQLQSVTTEHPSAILISEDTCRFLQGRFVTRELDARATWGPASPMKVYAVMPNDIRKYPRTVLEAGARLDRMGGGSAHVTTRDISAGGLAVSGVPEDWLVGTLVLIRCEGGWLPKPLGAAGTIVWRRGVDAGILFRALDPDAVPPVAGRRLRRH